jgi:dTDP-4-dehydrorhamnose reductase
MLRRGVERDQLSIVDGEVSHPIYTQDKVVAVVPISLQLNSCDEIKGIYHYSFYLAYSRFEFALEKFGS